MTDWSRRDLLRAGAGAAAAIPFAAMAADPTSRSTGEDSEDVPSEADLASFGADTVVVSIRDAARGDVAIYRGLDEVVVQDRRLVAQVLHAANSGQAS